jgi:hypothetical protein
MTLWGLMMALCFTMRVALALETAARAKVGFGGYALALTIGVALGVGCAWAMWAVGKIIYTHLQRPHWEHREPLKEWLSRALYFAAILWILFAGILGAWVTSASLRIIHI